MGNKLLLCLVKNNRTMNIIHDPIRHKLHLSDGGMLCQHTHFSEENENKNIL